MALTAGVVEVIKTWWGKNLELSLDKFINCSREYEIQIATNRGNESQEVITFEPFFVHRPYVYLQKWKIISQNMMGTSLLSPTGSESHAVPEVPVPLDRERFCDKGMRLV